MFSLWVKLTVYKQCYGVTLMNSFSFSLLILYDSLSHLFSILQPESWNFIHLDLLHISTGFLCIWEHQKKKRLHRGKRQWHFVPFSLEESFTYHTRRSCLFRILASTGPYFLLLLVPALPDCFGAGVWDWRKKKRKMEIFHSFF